MLCAWWAIVLVALAVAACVTDLRSGKIYNFLTYPAIAIGLVGHTLAGGLVGDGADIGLAGSAAGLAMGFFPMMVVALSGGINGGDVKLMGAVGALIGWRLTVSAILLTFVAAAVLAVIVILYRRVFWRTLRRVGFFIWQLLGMSRPIDPASADSPKVPFGVAIALGAVAAVAEYWLLGASEGFLGF